MFNSTCLDVDSGRVPEFVTANNGCVFGGCSPLIGFGSSGLCRVFGRHFTSSIG